MDIALQNVESSPTRVPLLEKPNSPPTPVRQVRRKTSFVRKVDSSEECPSPHDSIYEAHYFSSTNSDESFNRMEQLQMVALKGADITISNVENIPTVPNSTSELPSEDVQFRYGHGTILETITEQKSNGTMRSLIHSRSANDIREMKAAPFFAHRDSMIVAKSPRRKHSFSLDDLNLINRSYHDACAMIERTARKPLPIHEIYASPKVPLRDPLERPSTPPGMPSWTAAQTPTPTIPRRPYHLPGTPNRLQRFLGIEPSGVTFSSRVPHPDAARVVSAPVIVAGSRVAPRFRPPRSAYGPIDRHPFNNCPVAPVPQARSPSKRVRFTPSATARDSAELNLRNAIESTGAAALHPMAPIQSMAPMLPIAQLGSVPAKSKLCLHRQIPQSVSTNALGGASRSNSVSSTAHLMSGALSPAAEMSPASPVIGSPDLRDIPTDQTGLGGNRSTRKFERSIPCWKCLVERAARFWAQTTSCLCFVCCGFECDDESVVYPAGYGYATDSGYFDNQGMDVVCQRRMVLEQTPASMV